MIIGLMSVLAMHSSLHEFTPLELLVILVLAFGASPEALQPGHTWLVVASILPHLFSNGHAGTNPEWRVSAMFCMMLQTCFVNLGLQVEATMIVAIQ